MVVMNVLRMVVDISFFATFGGLVLAGLSGAGIFGGMLLQSLCFGLSSLGRERRGVRLVSLLPMAFCWLGNWATFADGIVLTPTGLYIVWLVWRGDYILDQERQQRLFSLFWKLALFAVFFGLLLEDRERVPRVIVPCALVMLAGSVFLMRSLRHTPSVYSGRSYQLINGGALLTVAAAGYLMSTRAVLESVAALLGAFYRGIILPILYLFIGLWIGAVQLISRLFQNLELKQGENELQNGVNKLDVTDILAEAGAPGTLAELIRKLLIALLACVGVFLLVLFFRWLNGRKDGEDEQSREKELRVDVVPQTQNREVRSSSAERSVRAQYRKFLKSCIRQGMQIKPDTTSLDVEGYASRLPGAGKVAKQIRELYLLARYARKTDRDSARTMKKLVIQAQKEMEKK